MSDTQKILTFEEIELRAYEIYLKRGDADGVALEDWLAAEKGPIRNNSEGYVRSIGETFGGILMFGDFR